MITYLQDSQCTAVLRQPPCIRPRDVPHARVRDLLEVKPDIVLPHVLEHLRTANVRLAKISQEVPQAELQRDLVRVRVTAEVLNDKGVVWVERLLVAAAVQDDADDLALLHLGELEL